MSSMHVTSYRVSVRYFRAAEAFIGLQWNRFDKMDLEDRFRILDEYRAAKAEFERWVKDV